MEELKLLHPGDIIRLETGMSIIASIPENVCNMDKPFSYKEKKSIVEIGKIYRSKPFTQYEIKGMVQNYLKENFGVEASDSQVHSLLDVLNFDYSVKEFDTSIFEGEYIVYKSGLEYPTKAFVWPVYCRKLDDSSIDVYFYQSSINKPYIPDIKAIKHDITLINNKEV